jgi:hypothetical protein
MGNRVENTKTFKGFRINKFYFNKFKESTNNCIYAYMGRDGNHTRPFIVYSCDDGVQYGIILEVTADGIEINGEFKGMSKPNIDTLTKDWENLLKEWLINSNEDWLLQ